MMLICCLSGPKRQAKRKVWCLIHQLLMHWSLKSKYLQKMFPSGADGAGWRVTCLDQGSGNTRPHRFGDTRPKHDIPPEWFAIKKNKKILQGMNQCNEDRKFCLQAIGANNLNATTILDCESPCSCVLPRPMLRSLYLGSWTRGQVVETTCVVEMTNK